MFINLLSQESFGLITKVFILMLMVVEFCFQMVFITGLENIRRKVEMEMLRMLVSIVILQKIYIIGKMKVLYCM